MATALTPDTRTVQLCSFWLAGRRFGVDILDVKEINDRIRITPVFQAPEAMRGYMNIRGLIHLVLDLRAIFGFEHAEPGHDTRVILFKSTVDEPFGVLVDRIDDVVEVRTDSIRERRKKGEAASGVAANVRKADAELTMGVCTLEKGLLVVLNARGILKSIDVTQKR
jgi:purine-binding chemotaxis protein CheW